jgi:hypothetical protein
MWIRISFSDFRGAGKASHKGHDGHNDFVTFVDFVRVDLMYSSPRRVPHAKY